MSDIQIKNLDQTAERMRTMPDRALQAEIEIIKALGDRWLLMLQDETPRGEGETSGALAGNYQTEESAGAGGVEYHIYNLTPYLRYVLKGRGPVYAINAKALRFVINGQVFFRRSVGPAEANDFPSRVRSAMQDDIAAAKQQIANLIVRSR